MQTQSWACSLQVFNLFQITPQGCGGVGNQLLISGREQCDLQPAVFEISPADYGSIHKNSRVDDSGEVENVTHRPLGSETESSGQSLGLGRNRGKVT